MHTQAKNNPGRTRNFQCPMCPSKFFTKISLNLHVPNHLKEKVLKCAQCNFSTHSHSCLNSHVKYHHGKALELFKCQFLGRKVSTKCRSSLRRHEKIHEPSTLLECQFPDCSFRTTAEIYLKRHICNNHNSEQSRLYVCPLCSKVLQSKNGFDYHI